MFSRNYNSSIEKFGVTDKDGDFDLVYYNATIINGKSSNTINYNDDPALKFQEARNVPIIHNAKKYEFSVIKFQINGANKNLPLFLPQIQLGQSNINLTAYSLGLSLTKNFVVGATTYTFNGYKSANIVFVPENQQYGSLTYGNLPAAPLIAQDINSTYYYVYNYDHFVNLVNTTFNTVYSSLVTAFNAYATANGSAQTVQSFAPFMTFDASTQLFSIYYDSYSFGGTFARSYGTVPTVATGAEAMALFFDSNLMGLFSSFDNNLTIVPQTFTPVGGSGIVTTTNTNEPYSLTVTNKLNSNIYLPNAVVSIVPTFPSYGTAYFKMTQNFDCTSSLWSPVSAVVLTSTQIPVDNENVSLVIQDGDSNDLSSNTSNNFSPIIADISLNAKTAQDYCNFIFYEPNGEFRMSSMMGGSNNNLTNIDITGYWRCRLDNQLYPIKMYNYSSASIKILFRKKKN